MADEKKFKCNKCGFDMNVPFVKLEDGDVFCEDCGCKFCECEDCKESCDGCCGKDCPCPNCCKEFKKQK